MSCALAPLVILPNDQWWQGTNVRLYSASVSCTATIQDEGCKQAELVGWLMSAVHESAPVRRAHGRGKAVLRAFGKEAIFSELSYSYPLKLLSPKLPSDGTIPVSIAYILSYGGGLVPGDRIELKVDVGAGASLMLLTQGSTKVFKTRAEHNYRLASISPSSLGATSSASDSVQHMDVKVGNGGLLLHLVDPVTCFRAASYSQYQIFRLEPDASLVVLDWITAGRMSRGEEWAFAKYHSAIEVWQAGRRRARDVIFLEQPQDTAPLPSRTLKDRLAPYACYATVLMFGPLVASTTARLTAEYGTISQMQRSGAPEFLWSLSLLDDGCVIRAAGRETEIVKEWLRDALSDLEAVVGKEPYSKAFV